MATFNKFDCFTENLAEAAHNLGADTLRVYLTNAAPVVGNTVFGTPAEIAAGSGYVAGGTQATITTSAQTAGIYKLVLADVVFAAAGGSIGPFRYAVLYNDTSATNALIGWYDYGSAVTLATGETFAVDFDPTAGALTLT